jgi:PAS domain-containing protein
LTISGLVVHKVLNHIQAIGLSRLLPRHLLVTFGLLFILLAAFAQIAFVPPALSYFQQRALDERVQAINSFWKAVVDPTTFPSLDETQVFLTRLIEAGYFDGVAVYDAAFDELGVIGERPNLTMSAVRRQDTIVLFDRTKLYYDVYFDPEDTGLSTYLITRVNVAPIFAELDGKSTTFRLYIFALTAMCSLAFITAYFFLISRPLKRLDLAVQQATDEPQRAEKYVTDMMRQDGVGRLASSVDLMFSALSVLHREELGVFNQAQTTSGFGIVHYDDKGQLISVNKALLDMMQVYSEIDFAERDASFVSFMMAQDETRHSVIECASEFAGVHEVTLHGDGNEIRCLMDTQTITNEDGRVLRYTAVFAPIEDVHARLDTSSFELSSLKNRFDALARREMEKKQMLESCLCLLDKAKPFLGPGEDMLPDRVVNQWYEEARSAHLVSGKLEHGLLPRCTGDIPRIRNVFRQAMLAVYARTEAERPTLAIVSEIKGDKAFFKVKDISDQRIGGGLRRKKDVDWQVPLSALRVALYTAGGNFVASSREGEVSSVTFSLKAAAKQEGELQLKKVG